MSETRNEDPRLRLVWRGLLAVGAVILFFAGFVWLWWHAIPVLYQGFNGISQSERLIAITNTRAALLAGLVGIGALGTLWLTGRAQRFTAKSLRVSAETLRISEQTFQLAERGHLTDRYTKAIDQLGNDKLDVRLGGIYALEQLAMDSEAHQATIVEVLSAFVRVHSDPVYQYKEHRSSLVAAREAQPEEELPDKAKEYVYKLDKPPVDVQAAVSVLGRLPVRPGVRRANLSGAWLCHVQVGGADFSGGQFDKANLSRAFLAGSTLIEASFVGAKLTKADFDYCDLRRSTLVDADLSGASLDRADLRNAQLIGVVPMPDQSSSVNGVGLIAAVKLTNARLTGTDLRGVDLVSSDLTDAVLMDAKLDGTRLHPAQVAVARGLTDEQLSTVVIYN